MSPISFWPLILTVKPLILTLKFSLHIRILAGRFVSSPEDIEDIKVNVVKTVAAEDVGLNLLDSGDSDAVAAGITALTSGTDSTSSSASTVNADTKETQEVKGESTVELWCVDDRLLHVDTFCTRDFFDSCVDNDRNNGSSNNNDNSSGSSSSYSGSNDSELIQPAYRVIDTDIPLCASCSRLFDSSLMSCDRAELSSFICRSDKAITMGLSYTNAREKLRKTDLMFAPYKHQPAYLLVKRILLQDAIEVQSRYVSSLEDARTFQDMRRQLEIEEHFKSKLFFGVRTVAIIEDEERQQKARDVIDYGKIRTYAEEYREELRGNIDCYSFPLPLPPVPPYFFLPSPPISSSSPPLPPLISLLRPRPRRLRLLSILLSRIFNNAILPCSSHTLS